MVLFIYITRLASNELIILKATNAPQIFIFTTFFFIFIILNQDWQDLKDAGARFL